MASVLTREDLINLRALAIEGAQKMINNLLANLSAEINAMDAEAAANNPKFVPAPADPVNPEVDGISVPPRFDDHGKLPPGCL